MVKDQVAERGRQGLDSAPEHPSEQKGGLRMLSVCPDVTEKGTDVPSASVTSLRLHSTHVQGTKQGLSDWGDPLSVPGTWKEASPFSGPKTGFICPLGGWCSTHLRGVS